MLMIINVFVVFYNELVCVCVLKKKQKNSWNILQLRGGMPTVQKPFSWDGEHTMDEQHSKKAIYQRQLCEQTMGTYYGNILTLGN